MFPELCTENVACNPSLDEFAAACDDVCAMDIDALRSKHPGVKDQYLVEYCQNGNYIVNLLERYGVARDVTNIYYASSIDGVSVG